MDVPDDLRYTQDHEWLRVEGGEATVGITAYAADQLGDVVFVELPSVGASLGEHQSFGVVESVKAVSDLYAPVGGEVIEVNSAVAGDVQILSEDPYGRGWLIKVRLTDPAADIPTLLDYEAYQRKVAESPH